MSTVSQNIESVHQITSSIQSFLQKFHVNKLLSQCNARKEKGVPVMTIFCYLLANVFADRSMYMQMRTGRFMESFSKNAYYRFLNSVRTNWTRFTTMLSARIIQDVIRPLTSEDRATVFILDDTLFSRTGTKKTELASRVFDHTDRRYKKGFRLLTLGWSDGRTFLPINSRLLASHEERNQLGPIRDFDRRSLAGRIRKQALQKGTTVMISLLKTALAAGHRAKYVLFDSWFSNPHQIVEIKDLGIDVIGMVKKSTRVKYLFEGQRLNIKEIFARCKKRRGRSKYLLSVEVMVGQEKENEHPIPARIVCVRNRANRKDWLALICTNPNLSEEEIIRIYGKRWDIEVFFKTSKSYLKLISGCHSLSYDALSAHVAIAFTQYMLLALEHRCNNDERTLGELFYLMLDEVADISFNHSLQILYEAMLASIQAVFQATDEQIQRLSEDFLDRLPEFMRERLQSLPSAA